MTLLPGSMLVQPNDLLPQTATDAMKPSALPLATARIGTQSADNRHPHSDKRFDDILEQTLAGPLFATWTPTTAIAPAGNKLATTSATVSALDAQGRREGGRRRSRR